MSTITTLKTNNGWITKIRKFGASIGKAITAFCKLGTDNPALDQEGKRKVYIVNLIGGITVLLNFLPGLLLLWLTSSLQIYIPSTTEGFLFMLVPYLNYKRRHNSAVMLMFGAHLASFLYFGLLFGPVVNFSAVATFLIGSIVLLYHSERYIYTSIAVAIVAIGILQVDYFYQFVPPLKLTAQVTAIINKLATSIVFLLNCITLYLYITALLKHKKRQEMVIQEKTADLQARTIQLEEKSAQLATAYEFLETFIHSTWHDLRQNVVNLMYLSKDFQNVQAEQDFPEKISITEDHITDLSILSFKLDQQVNNVFEFTLLRAGKQPDRNLGIITLRQWAEEIIQVNLLTSKKKKVNITLTIAADTPPRLVTDVRWLSRIMNNLISNAIKFTEVESTIEMEIGVGADKNYVEFRIKDQGPGIAKDQLEQIFLPFTTTRNSFQPGYGIGLPNARVLAQSLEGDISVISTVGEGAVFTFHHPFLQFHHQDTNPVVNQKVSFDANILLIDDNEMMHMNFANRLKPIGCKMTSAYSGMEGLEAAREYPKPDLIILDLKLPDIKGQEVLETLKKDPSTRNIPVLMASTIDQADLKEEMMALGADGFIRKELTTDNIEALLPKFLAYSIIEA